MFKLAKEWFGKGLPVLCWSRISQGKYKTYQVKLKEKVESIVALRWELRNWKKLAKKSTEVKTRRSLFQAIR